jgi:hypothetical protein
MFLSGSRNEKRPSMKLGLFARIDVRRHRENVRLKSADARNQFVLIFVKDSTSSCSFSSLIC